MDIDFDPLTHHPVPEPEPDLPDEDPNADEPLACAYCQTEGAEEDDLGTPLCDPDSSDCSDRYYVDFRASEAADNAWKERDYD